MSDFFKKLNVLVKASLNDLLDSDPGTSDRGLRPDKLGKNIDAEVKALRQRVNDALDYEDQLVQRVQSLQQEAETLDGNADQALEQGREDEARQILLRLQATRQRLSMAEADLQDHRSVTRELIVRVNELDAAVADARQRETREGADAAPEDAMQRAGQVVSDVLQQMRERIAELSSLTGVPDTVTDEEKPESQAADEQAVADDLARRLERLSKK
jgi:phage shock protein A